MLILLTLLAMEIKPGTSAPAFRQPQMAARESQVALVYGAGTAVYFASSSDAGHNFAPAIKVADLAGLMLGRHRGPRVSILPHAIVISAVGAKGDLAVWRSADSGKTWTSAPPVNDVPGAAKEGLHAMVADHDGNLFATWLDLRAPGTTLYGAGSRDGGLTWGKNVAIYRSPAGTICQCCDPSLAIGEKGEISVMWRNFVDGNRDMYLSHSSDGVHFSSARKLGDGTWPLNACPMDGGGLAMNQGRLISAWRRGTQIYLDEPGKPETVIGAGKDVTVAAGKKGIYVIWTGEKGLQAKVPGKPAISQLSTEGAFPSLTALPDGSVLAAWEEKGAIRVEALP